MTDFNPDAWGDIVASNTIFGYMDLSGTDKTVTYTGWLRVGKVSLVVETLAGPGSIEMKMVQLDCTMIFDLFPGCPTDDSFVRSMNQTFRYPLAARSGVEPNKQEKEIIERRRGDFLKIAEGMYAYTSSPMMPVPGLRGIKAPDGRLFETDDEGRKILSRSWHAAPDYVMAEGWGQPYPGAFPAKSWKPTQPPGKTNPDFYYWNLSIEPQKAYNARMEAGAQTEAQTEVPGGSVQASETWTAKDDGIPF